MNNLTEKILTKLKQSEYWTAATRESGATIQGLTCPACGTKGAGWCYMASPMSINCNRMNNCRNRTKTLELFNIHQDIEREFKPTKSEPKRPATVFLESRGLKQSLKDLKYYYQQNVRKTGRGAVMFPIGKTKEGKNIANGRLINPRSKDKKSHNSGSTSGHFWQHPGFKYDPYKPIFIVEGIIDALSLIEIGQQAIAILASGQDPAKIDIAFFHKLVLALDNDLAGARATKKWQAQYPEAETLMPDPGGDWNDLLCSGSLDHVKKQFESNLPRYHTNTALALAPTAKEYATIYRDFYNRVPGLFQHDGCTYYSFLKQKGDDTRLIVERCGRFTLKVIAYHKNTSNPEHPEFRYHLQITPKAGRPIQAIASGKDLATPRGLKEFFLTRAKVSYEAGAPSCTALATRITTAKTAPEVNQLSLTGYDIETRWYVFKNFAIDTDGKLHHPDKRGLYKTNFRDWSTPPPHAAEKAIKPALTGIAPKGMHDFIVKAWGHNGAVAMSWIVAGWFVNQIKEQIGYFPFFSLHGDPASGKSALTVMLNAMQGIDGEGIPLSQLNTKKALARSISRVSGMFTALLEDNQRNERAFDYSVILTGYNQGPLQLKAAFSNDNRTTESPFQGSLMFVQNTEPFNQKAEKQRVISLHFDHADLTDETRAAYEQLCKIPLPELARMMPLTLQQRKIFEEGWLEAYHQAIEDLSPQEHRRILQNHALILAFHRLFCKVHKIKYDLTEFIRKTTEKKCQTSAIKDYSLADHFFELIDSINEDKTEACLHMDTEKRLFYLNLTGLEYLIRNRGIQFTVNDFLTQALTRHPAFMENSKRFRFPRDPEMDSTGKQPKQRRSWVFDANKFE